MLKDKGILITGASRGLGRAIAKACLKEGAHVFLCARDSRALKDTQKELKTCAASGQEVLIQPADVSNAKSVRLLIQSASKKLPNFMGLVNNAGVQGPPGQITDVNWKHWVKTVEINLMGTVLACRAVLPLFIKRRYGKIVNLSGGGATNPRPYFSAYAASKAAVVRFTENLSCEVQGLSIDINAMAPGALNTRMLDEVIAAGASKVGNAAYQRALDQKQKGGASIERAAKLCVLLLSPSSDGITGRLISAVWDSWEKLPERKPELASSDIYALRRITPQDRGYSW